MKKLLYLFTILFAIAFAACEGTEPPTSNKVETGASENITQTSATLKGAVNVEIADYNSVEFGVMYDTLLAEVNNRSAQMIKGSVLMGKDFSINLVDLTENTKYYYCAYLLLNGMQYEFGAVKEFVTLSSSDKPEDPSTPGSSSFIAKPFSVSATKTVTFSPGNLQYHAANNEWRFAPSQLDYVGAENANISPSYNGWIDLFGWGTGNNPTNASIDYEDYPTFVDWGVNKIGNDAPNTWRTLTDEEWKYIINGRSNASNLKGVAQVNGVNGLILLPDGWTCPSGVTFKSGFNAETYYSPYAIEEYQTFNASDWAKLEASGAVFLPAAGGRFDDNINELQEVGGYWSIGESIAIGTFPGFAFSSRRADIYPWDCETGHSVRLVTTLASIDEPAYTAVFIRGQFNEWGETYELTTTDGDYYALDATFDLTGEFKIASSDWRTINYGGTYTIFAGTEQVLIEGSNDNLTAYGNIAVAKVEFTVSTGILLITAAQTPSTPEQPEDPSTPGSGSFVSKPFSVSATQTVAFSPGNLQYHPVNDEWRFAPNQSDYIGEANANISATYNGWIDLFGWGTGNNPTNNSTDYEDYPTFVDWGVNKIGNDAPNTWRTLTYQEWNYLRWERPNYDKLIGVAQVNGVNGLILLPDSWTCPSGVTFKSGFHEDYGIEYYAAYQTFGASEWSKLEASGAVFLPAADYRVGSGVDSVQDLGSYWSATEGYSNYLDLLYFSSDGAGMSIRVRHYGLSVRLVQD